jgi:hypothetical protein
VNYLLKIRRKLWLFKKVLDLLWLIWEWLKIPLIFLYGSCSLMSNKNSWTSLLIFILISISKDKNWLNLNVKILTNNGIELLELFNRISMNLLNLITLIFINGLVKTRIQYYSLKIPYQILLLPNLHLKLFNHKKRSQKKKKLKKKSLLKSLLL